MRFADNAWDSLSADLRATMSLVIEGVRYAHQRAAQWSRDFGLFR